jgi:trehalose 6-phosphate synthase/phosphatase
VSRIILASNRLPVRIGTGHDGAQTVEPSSGGLVAGLGPIHEEGDGLWFGHPGPEPDASARRYFEEHRLVPVECSAELYGRYYDGYSNGALWPLFHYLIDRCEFREHEYAAYVEMNERFADAIAAQASPDDTIWVHDYQLMLLPRLLRQRLPEARIGFFLHIPFPSSEVFRVLPEREELLRGLLGADLIGVHTYEYADNLSRSIRRLLGLEAVEGRLNLGARTVRIEVHPLGVDVGGLRQASYSPEAEQHLRNLRDSVGDRRLILGVDRLDYTKGLPLKFEAVRQLLEREPSWRSRAVLIQLAVPSREQVQPYRDQRAEVERLSGEINGLFGSPGQIPIHYQYRSVSPAELGAMYRLADVALVTPVRDGLNLVAKEYVAVHDGPGTLVLSEFAGAASELGEALRVNPWDVAGTAAQLERALEMGPDESEARMAAMRERVRTNDVRRWASSLMSSLSEPAEGAFGSPPLVRGNVLADTVSEPFATAARPLVMLDYDGSLREFEPRYEAAQPTQEIYDLLAGLGAQAGVSVFINSGRDRDTLGRWFDSLPLALLAEHGSWLRLPRENEWEPIGPAPDLSWKGEVRRVLARYADRTPGARIEEKSASLVWHYREVEEDLGDWQALELTSVLETMLHNVPVQVVHGARIVEVRQQGLDKGRAYELVESRFGPFDFVLATGDDRTDEDLFERLDANAFTVKVGSGPSRAHVAVSTPASVRQLLQAMLDARRTVHTEPAAEVR